MIALTDSLKFSINVAGSRLVINVDLDAHIELEATT